MGKSKKPNRPVTKPVRPTTGQTTGQTYQGGKSGSAKRPGGKGGGGSRKPYNKPPIQANLDRINNRRDRLRRNPAVVMDKRADMAELKVPRSTGSGWRAR